MAEKTVNKKKKKDRAGRPVTFAYKVGLFLFALYLRVFRGLHIDRSGLKGVKGPYFVVCNHQSFVDFGAAAAICRPNVVDFVVSTHFFRDKLLSIGLRLGGCIPKKQFYPDLSAVRKMLRAVKEGRCVGLFPEGQTCVCGSNNDVDPAIGKLIKAMGVPVVNVQIRGNFLAMPKYAVNKLFPGRSEARGYVLLTKEEVESLSDEEIAQRITEGIAYDDYEWQRGIMKKSRKPRDLENIENVLWLCPQCGSEHTMRTEGRDLYCEKCGYRVTTDDYGFLHGADGTDAIFDTPPKWFAWQFEEIGRRIDAGGFLPLRSHGRFLESSADDFSEHGYGCHGEGECTLDKDGLTLDVIRDGEPFHYTAIPSVVYNLTHNADLWAFDLPGNTTEDRDFAFDPDESRDMMKFVQTWTVIRRKFHE